VLNEERRRAILDLLTHQGRVLVTELARKFETSQVTIRKDLEILHAHGLVHRTTAVRSPPATEPSKIPRCAKKKNSTTRKNFASPTAPSKKSKKARC
jgi:DeoR family fructose operon transcriptional repressor